MPERHDMNEESRHSLGTIFRNARREKNISVEDVVEATRIHSRFIKDLEEDNYKNMPAKVFVRGFIKLYAEFLGISADESLGMYFQQLNSDHADPDQTPYRQDILIDKKYADPEAYRKNRKKRSLLIIFLTLLAILLFVASLLPKLSEKLNSVDPENSTLQESSPVVNPESAEKITDGSDDQQIIVDRPPSITITETHDQERSSAEEQKRKPAESTGISAQKVYKSEKSNRYQDIQTTSDSTDDPAEVQTSDALIPRPAGGKHNPQKVEASDLPLLSVEQELIPVAIEESLSTGSVSQNAPLSGQSGTVMNGKSELPQSTGAPDRSSSAETAIVETPITSETGDTVKADKQAVSASPRFQPVTVTVSTAETIPGIDRKPTSVKPPQDNQPSQNDLP